MQRNPQFENEDVAVWKTTVMPNAPLTMHTHQHPRVIIAVLGGTMKVVYEDGVSEMHPWDTGKAGCLRRRGRSATPTQTLAPNQLRQWVCPRLYAALRRVRQELEESWPHDHGIQLHRSHARWAMRKRPHRIVQRQVPNLTVGSSKLDRKDVVRVGDGTSVTDHDPIYSGRSSWSDLQRSEPNKYERIQLE